MMAFMNRFPWITASIAKYIATYTLKGVATGYPTNITLAKGTLLCLSL
jgi:hypothetical protein